MDREMSKKEVSVNNPKWAESGISGIHCSLQVDTILVDHTYQRGQVAREKIMSIAKSFNWTAFGELVIAERPNGDKFVIDGQQRLAAAKLRGERFVPCMVFRSSDIKEEAQSFISSNINRTNVPSLYKFKAGVIAGNQPEIDINHWLDSMGLSVGEKASSRTIDFVANLLATWKTESRACKNAIVLQHNINRDEDCFNCLVHKGLWFLYTKGIPVHDYTKKLIEKGGKTGILRSIRQVQIEAGYKSANYSMCSRGLLNIINSGKRSGRIVVQLNTAEEHIIHG